MAWTFRLQKTKVELVNMHDTRWEKLILIFFSSVQYYIVVSISKCMNTSLSLSLANFIKKNQGNTNSNAHMWTTFCANDKLNIRQLIVRKIGYKHLNDLENVPNSIKEKLNILSAPKLFFQRRLYNRRKNLADHQDQ